jgi:hypothetical protein
MQKILCKKYQKRLIVKNILFDLNFSHYFFIIIQFLIHTKLYHN